jgi:hypothetical protein
MTSQEERLFESACHWFLKACEAFESGDKIGHRVAMLAHKMTVTAHKNSALGIGQRPGSPGK